MPLKFNYPFLKYDIKWVEVETKYFWVLIVRLHIMAKHWQGNGDTFDDTNRKYILWLQFSRCKFTRIDLCFMELTSFFLYLLVFQICKLFSRAQFSTVCVINNVISQELVETLSFLINIICSAWRIRGNIEIW